MKRCLLGVALQGLLPVEGGFVFEPAPLALAAAYGLLVAFAFAATPLLRARAFPAMALMRARVSPLARDLRALVWTGLGIAAICAFFEKKILIGVIVDGIAAIHRWFGYQVRLLLDGHLHRYVTLALLGTVFVLVKILVAGGE